MLTYIMEIVWNYFQSKWHLSYWPRGNLDRNVREAIIGLNAKLSTSFPSVEPDRNGQAIVSWCIVRKLKSKLPGNVSLITPRLWPLWEGTRGVSSASVALCGCTEGSVPGFKVKKLISVACAVWDLSGGRCDSGKLIKSYVVTVVAVKTRVADRNLSGSYCNWLALKLKSFFRSCNHSRTYQYG